ncbi:MAG: preprotein translocase subunit YajC [Acidobacteria bacterium]|nr:MAG: preprotein translocase subunit YajC [Acidobacteriota bacterium]
MIAQLASVVFFQFQPASGMNSILMMVAVFAVFYVLLILPQQKRQKKWQAMIDGLKSGDRVVTTGGIVGIILSIKQGEGADVGSIILRVAPDNLKLEVSRNAIASVSVSDSGTKS